MSAFRSIRDWLREPKVTVPAQYYRGEATLPATDMRPWFMDLPSQLKVAFEKPRDPSDFTTMSSRRSARFVRLRLLWSWEWAAGFGGKRPRCSWESSPGLPWASWWDR